MKNEKLMIYVFSVIHGYAMFDALASHSGWDWPREFESAGEFGLGHAAMLAETASQ
jgi:hypothetical protein